MAYKILNRIKALKKFAEELDALFGNPEGQLDRTFKILEDSFSKIESITDFKHAKSEEILEIVEQNPELFLQYPIKEYLGSGSYGVAFVTDDDKVLKLSEDPGDLYFYERLFNEDMIDSDYAKYNAKVYDFGILKLPYSVSRKRRGAWVIQERLNKKEHNSEEDARLFERLFKSIRQTDINQYLEAPITISDNGNDIKTTLKEIAHLVLSGKHTDTVDNIANHIVEKEIGRGSFAYEVIMSEAISREDFHKMIRSIIYSFLRKENDTHYDNLGYRDNEQPIFFDPYRNHNYKEEEHVRNRFLQPSFDEEYKYDPIDADKLKEELSSKAQMKQSNDYQSNFLDKFRKKLKKRKKRKDSKQAFDDLLSGKKEKKASNVHRELELEYSLPVQGETPLSTPEPSEPIFHNDDGIGELAAKAGVPALFLKAVLSVSELEADFYLPFSFKQNPKAVDAANELNFELFVEHYFGEHYIDKGLARELRESYEKLSSKN